MPNEITLLGHAIQKDITVITAQDLEGCESIGQYAFDRCSSLTSVVIPDSVISIGNSAFNSCSSLTNVTIGEGVASIGGSAFSYCTSLTSVSIPGSVTSISGGAFRGCRGLTSLTVSDNNEVYHSSGNCIIETESKTLVCGCKNSMVPDDGSVTSIGKESFSEYSLTNITIPDSVTSIGDSAFSGCNSLTNITIPDGVTSIGRYTFFSCTILMSVTCKSIAPPVVDSTSFSGVPSTCNIYVPASSVSAYQSAQYWSDRAAHIQAIPNEVI